MTLIFVLFIFVLAGVIYVSIIDGIERSVKARTDRRNREFLQANIGKRVVDYQCNLGEYELKWGTVVAKPSLGVKWDCYDYPSLGLGNRLPETEEDFVKLCESGHLAHLKEDVANLKRRGRQFISSAERERRSK